MVFFLFGWGETTEKRLSDTPVEICDGCHADYLYLTKRREWFTLFFIPIIPYDKKYLIVCSNCKCGYEIKEDVNIKDLISELNSINNESA